MPPFNVRIDPPGTGEIINTVAASGTAQALAAPDTAQIQDITLTANCTLTFPAVENGKSFTLLLRQDATGSRAIIWPAAVEWAGGGTNPVLSVGANQKDLFSFLGLGGVWLGFITGFNFA